MAGSEGVNMEQFEAFFQSADLDRDGRISGDEAVKFFRESNLPERVLAQIWMYVDVEDSGFLSRPAFYNALKLVTVAQNKYELTPNHVKATLYGHASAQIPPPHINLVAIPGQQPKPVASPPTGAPALPSSLNLVSEGVNMEQFEVFFQRAALDRDGKISGAEAVNFLQGSNLPRVVLAQIWMYADQDRSGFLSRLEFYNALKLVTVAQSKRKLTPKVVMAALYGPAYPKIPPPQINRAVVPGQQPNSK